MKVFVDSWLSLASISKARKNEPKLQVEPTLELTQYFWHKGRVFLDVGKRNSPNPETCLASPEMPVRSKQGSTVSVAPRLQSNL